MDVKGIAKQRGFTMTAIAEKMGITYVTLSQTLSRNPTIKTLQRIADILGCRVGDFFLDEQTLSANGNAITCPNCGAKLELKQV